MGLCLHLRVRVSCFYDYISIIRSPIFLTFYYPASSSVCCVTASRTPRWCPLTRHSLWSVPNPHFIFPCSTPAKKTNKLTIPQIYIPDCDAGWLPTQHVLLRVLSGSGIFESHPFTITNAPSTPFSASPRGIILYAKVAGDWTKKLHDLARDIKSLEVGDDLEEKESFLAANNKARLSGGGEGMEGMDHPGKRVQVMIDGPYGGLKMDLGQYESVLLVGGGSGITFILGSIEEALRVREKGKGPAKVDVAWIVKDLCK